MYQKKIKIKEWVAAKFKVYTEKKKSKKNKIKIQEKATERKKFEKKWWIMGFLRSWV